MEVLLKISTPWRISLVLELFMSFTMIPTFLIDIKFGLFEVIKLIQKRFFPYIYIA